MRKAEINGSYTVSDEAYVAVIGGKLTLQGIYTGDIVIPQNGLQVQQLIFFLQIAFPLERCPKRISVELFFPKNNDPFVLHLSSIQISATEPPEGRTRRYLRFPFPLVAPTLYSGRISVFVVFDDKKIELDPTWIITAEEHQKRMTTASLR